jgi:hypothetical protein
MSVGKGREQWGLMVSYYEACKHQPLMPVVSINVPGPMFSAKAVFTFSEM